MSRILGGGDSGVFLDKTFYPDTTFKAELISLDSSATYIVGKLVQLATSGNYYVTSPAASAYPDGDIVAFEKDITYGYKLTVRLWNYTSIGSTLQNPKNIVKFPYASAPTLGHAIVVTGGTYRYVRSSATTGVGFVLAVDTTNETCDVLI